MNSKILLKMFLDKMLEKLISEGVDTVINLGYGLDTRPYRMKLPSQLNWIEVDYPKIIPYLKSEMVKELSNDLMGFSNVKFWITEYLNEKSYKYLKDPKRMNALKNAPF